MHVPWSVSIPSLEQLNTQEIIIIIALFLNRLKRSTPLLRGVVSAYMQGCHGSWKTVLLKMFLVIRLGQPMQQIVRIMLFVE